MELLVSAQLNVAHNKIVDGCTVKCGSQQKMDVRWMHSKM